MNGSFDGGQPWDASVEVQPTSGGRRDFGASLEEIGGPFPNALPAWSHEHEPLGK